MQQADSVTVSRGAVADVLTRAEVSGEWLAAGPIRPQVRSCGQDGVFLLGNAAGEAHPIVAEGISMAIQSAWLLCERLITQKDALFLVPPEATFIRLQYTSSGYNTAVFQIT